MKKLVPAIAIVLSSIFIISCGNSENKTAEETQTQAIASVKADSSSINQTTTIANKDSVKNSNPNNQANTNTTKQSATKQPKIGTVKSMTNGDLLCYVVLVDEQNKEHNVGADFDICANEQTFLNQKVQLSYEIASVNDCESAEPCGKTRQESIITKMEILKEEKPNSSQPGDLQTLSNGKWTIIVGNRQSWSGVNGTGNLTYKGCDANNKCLELNGGKVTCRDGKCVTSWKNGDYSYALEQPITNPDQPKQANSFLIVRKKFNVILTITQLKDISSDNSNSPRIKFIAVA